MRSLYRAAGSAATETAKIARLRNHHVHTAETLCGGSRPVVPNTHVAIWRSASFASFQIPVRAFFDGPCWSRVSRPPSPA